MCDYSLEHVMSRDARVSDILITTKFSMTNGFAEVGRPSVAVCLRPGTELAFDHDVVYETNALFFGRQRIAGLVARFRQIEPGKPHVHHDALEFSDGAVVLLTHLVPGQTAKVLQTPSASVAHEEQVAGKLPDAIRPLEPVR